MVHGKVYLVGAGPGNPKLLTLRAAELLEKADIVIYDRLVGSSILKLIPKTAKKSMWENVQESMKFRKTKSMN